MTAGITSPRLRLILAVGLALGAHVAAFAMVPHLAGSDDGAGEAGQALVSLQAASGDLQALVDLWERPPELAGIPDLVAPEAVSDAPPAPRLAPRDLDEAPPQSTVNLGLPALAPGDAAPNPMPSPAPAQPLGIAIPPELGAPDLTPPDLTPPVAAEEVVALATAQSQDPPPRIAEDVIPQAAPLTRPKARPKAQTVAQTAAQPKPNTQPQRPAKAAAAPKPKAAFAGQKASGAGKGAVAGQGGAAKTTTLSKAKITDLKAGWGAAIRGRIEARKRYPAQAKGASGKIMLRLTVTRAGQLAAVSVAKSSGSAVLDAAAIRAVTVAGRFAAAPKGLTEGSYTFTLPMSFSR